MSSHPILSSRTRKSLLVLFSLLLCTLACDLRGIFMGIFGPQESPIAVNIVEPLTGTHFKEGEMIHFVADIQFEEEAEIEKTIWESDKDGVLQVDPVGNGTLFQTDTLSPGRHEITFYAETTNKRSAMSTTTIIVLGKEVSEEHDLTVSLSTDQPESIEDLWAHEVAFRIKGDCPPVDAEYTWALPEEKPCKLMWDVYYDIDALALDLGFLADPEKAWGEMTLSGVLLIKESYKELFDEDEGEIGYGTISARGPLGDLYITEDTPGSIVLEGSIPIDLVCEGDYLILHTSDGYNIFQEGGVDTTLNAWVKVDFSRRRLEIRYEEYPLEIPTGIGDGNTIENLRLDIALIWAE